MVFTLGDIKRACRPKPGGLKQIALIVPAELIAVPEYADIPLADDLVFAANKRAWIFQVDRLSARLTDKQVVTQTPGDFFEYTLTAASKAIRLDVEALRYKLTDRRVHVLVTYQDGARRLLVNMRFAIGSDSGLRIKDRNGYDILATCKLSSPAPLLDGMLSSGDIITDQYGDLILIAPNGTYWKLTINDCGTVKTIQVYTGDGVHYYPISGQMLGVDNCGTAVTM